MKIRTKKTIITVSVAIQALWTSASGDCQKPISNWGTAILGTRVEPVNGPQVDVWFISEESGKLVGSCMLANMPSGNYKPRKLVIEGEWHKGAFWATTILQVSDLAKGPWRTISTQSNKPAPVKVAVEPDSILSDFKVNLEQFRGYIGKFKVGRVVLNSGDAGVFELSDLKPPTE